MLQGLFSLEQLKKLLNRGSFVKVEFFSTEKNRGKKKKFGRNKK